MESKFCIVAMTKQVVIQLDGGAPEAKQVLRPLAARSFFLFAELLLLVQAVVWYEVQYPFSA